MDWPVLRSDEVRKQLAGLDPLARAGRLRRGPRTPPPLTGATYAAMLTRVRWL